MRASSTRPTRAVRTTSLRFGERSQAVGIRCSMGSVGDGSDNALAPSFCASLQGELRARQPLWTHNEARPALFSSLLHRGLLQPAAAAFGARRLVAGGV